MKINLNESNFGYYFYLTPETPQEVTMLMRLAKATKKKKPRIHFSFGADPSLSISMHKVQKNNQKNYLNND